MTDPELDKKLAAARTPDLSPDDDADFPRAVLARLRSAPAAQAASQKMWLPRLAWGLSFALVFLIIGFAIGHWRGKTELATTTPDLLADAKVINETLALFPNRIRAIIKNDHGLQLVLSDQPDVPNSTPLFVKICDGKNCSSLVTFSGQELEIAGQKITVLADSHGGVILEGNQFVWSSGMQNLAQNGLRIEARTLSLAKL
jgi:hypothetical protein